MKKPMEQTQTQTEVGAERPLPAGHLGVLAALERAAQRAREIARQTDTAVIVMRDSEIVRIRPGIDEE